MHLYNKVTWPLSPLFRVNGYMIIYLVKKITMKKIFPKMTASFAIANYSYVIASIEFNIYVIPEVYGSEMLS